MVVRQRRGEESKCFVCVDCIWLSCMHYLNVHNHWLHFLSLIGHVVELHRKKEL